MRATSADASRREKELTLVGGNAGALAVVSNLRQGFAADDVSYERELDRLIEEGLTGTALYAQRTRVYRRIAEEMSGE